MNWELLTDDFNRSVHLFDHDLVVLLLLVVGFDALPRQPTLDYIQNHIPNTFKIVSSGLLDAKVSIDGGVTGCSCEVLVLFIWNMNSRLCIPILLGQTCTSLSAQKNTIWLTGKKTDKPNIRKL